MNQDYSDEMLNAYLDNELAGVEKIRLLSLLRTDKDLRQRVCQLEQVRKMVAMAYHDVAAEQHIEHVKPRRMATLAAVAASLFVAVGAVLGWYAHQQMHTEPGLLALAGGMQFNQRVASDSETWRVLMHVTSDDPYRINTLLNETEALLHEYDANNQKVAIQILANGKGLNLLRSDKTPYGKRIAALQAKYDNLVFSACAQAIARLEQEKGEHVQLLPNTKIAPSAISEVLNRQREGWTYIKI